MPPKAKPTTDENLAPYLFHRLDLNGSPEATGECPFCGKDKFNVKLSTGQAKCWTCCGNEIGWNARTFTRKIFDDSVMTEEKDLEALALDRGILDVETLTTWGVRKSCITGEWIVPGYGATGTLNTVYKYINNAKGKRVLIPTPTLGHHLFGVHLFDPKKPDVYFHESLWNAMVMWEAMSKLKQSDDDLIPTGNVSASLIANANFLATPGCKVFNDSWCALMAGKRVCLCYDTDHPKAICQPCKVTYSTVIDTACPACNKEYPPTIDPAGSSGAKHVAQMLAAASDPPAEIYWLRWHDELEYHPELTSGFDVRDLLTKEED